jgi:serine/threonine protein phosphatase PrpC
MYDHYQIISHFLTDIGLQRSQNEDNFGSLQLSDGQLFIVCDGMGGHKGGEYASSTCVSLIKEYFSHNATGNTSVDLYNAILFANEQLYQTSINNPSLKGMGTTVVALVIRGSEIIIGHVGDSRIYLHSSGKLLQLTKDHSYVQTLVDQGIIMRHEMESHSRKNELTQAIGVSPTVKPWIGNSNLQVKAGDKFVLCTDGLFGMISEDTILEELNATHPHDYTCSRLISKAKSAGGLDNITLCLVSVLKSPFKQTKHEGLHVAGGASGATRKRINVKNVMMFALAALIPITAATTYLVLTDNNPNPLIVKPEDKQKEVEVKPEDIAWTKFTGGIDTLEYSIERIKKLKNLYLKEFTNVKFETYTIQDISQYEYDTFKVDTKNILYFRSKKFKLLKQQEPDKKSKGQKKATKTSGSSDKNKKGEEKEKDPVSVGEKNTNDKKDTNTKDSDNKESDKKDDEKKVSEKKGDEKRESDKKVNDKKENDKKGSNKD